MGRVYNFSAGPSTLPLEVLQKAQNEMIDYGSMGHSVMEMSHRSSAYQSIIDKTEQLMREILGVPNNYKIMFLQGGASSQFAMVPMNLMKKYKKADVLDTGYWIHQAIEEAKKFGECRVVASSKNEGYTYLPKPKKEDFSDESDFILMCDNNTLFGTQYHKILDVGDKILVSDMSSCICSKPIDVSKYGLIYAGAQKNIGCAGTTIVIIRDDLLEDISEQIPTMMNYSIHAKNGSMYNTPPTYAIYICGLVLEWIKENMGGLEKVNKHNLDKARILYQYLDQSKLFIPRVKNLEDRSLMNVTFSTLQDEMDNKFISFAKENNIINIRGHVATKGMRASIYNAMSIEGVKALVETMDKFEKSVK